MPKRRVGFRISEPLLVDLKMMMKEEGYRQRQKSQWVSQSIEKLLQQDAKAMLEKGVFTGDSLNRNSIGEVVSLDEDLLDEVTCKMIELRHQDPLLEDVQSMLIRASIKSRIEQVKAGQW
jgi:hypothetical protein